MSLLPTYHKLQRKVMLADHRSETIICRAYLEFFMGLSNGFAVRLLSPTVSIFAKETQSLPVEQEHTATCEVCQCYADNCQSRYSEDSQRRRAHFEVYRAPPVKPRSPKHGSS